MFHLSLYFAFFAALVSATSRCGIVERGSHGFEANFYSYELRDEVGWKPGFFQKGGYNKGEVLHTVTGVKKINFGFCLDSYDKRYGHIYGQQTTVSNYTIELTGYFTPTSTGNHKFYVKAENGVSLQISRGLSCCNSPKGDNHGDYELHMLDNGHGDENSIEDNFYLEDGVRYFIKIVTFNWQASGGLKVGFFTPNNEHADEMGSMIYQDKYDTTPCPISPSDLQDTNESINEGQKAECSSCAEVATASKDFERTSTESGISAVKISEEISNAAPTTAKLSIQSLEPEISSECESCLPNLDARPTDAIFGKTSEKSTSVVASKCIDIESALLDVFSTSEQGPTSLEHVATSGQSTLVSSSTDKVPLKTKENSNQDKEDVPNEKVTATTSTQRISNSEPSVSPVLGSISPGSVDKPVDTLVVQNTSELKVSGTVSASAAHSGEVSTKSSSDNVTSTPCTEDCKIETGTTYVTMTTTNESGKTVTVTYCPSTDQAQPSDICIAGDSVCLSYAAYVNVYPTPALVNNSKAKPSAADSETKENKATETAKKTNETATTCTEDCPAETSTTYVTMTTTNEIGKTVTVTYCPNTKQAQPSDICIAGDSVCLSYALSVNVFPTLALVSNLKAKPSAAVSETKENKVMETATTCTEDCKVETSTTYVTMITTNESGKTVTVTYCPSTDQAQPSDICIAGDSVCLSYAASVNVFPTPALVSTPMAAEPKSSTAISEAKENQVMGTAKKTDESNSPLRSSNTAANLQPAQSVETGSPAKGTSSGNSKEPTPAKVTPFGNNKEPAPEETTSVTITSTTRSKAGPNSPVPVANSIENGASQIGACAPLNILASLAVALISLLVFA
ncbi:hypothetical protein OY671_003265 [Metschnikowia pulcherrima]|nr:hypothetical protein OY671_003265 [Metschnikowia pulcherrima]